MDRHRTISTLLPMLLLWFYIHLVFFVRSIRSSSGWIIQVQPRCEVSKRRSAVRQWRTVQGKEERQRQRFVTWRKGMLPHNSEGREESSVADHLSYFDHEEDSDNRGDTSPSPSWGTTSPGVVGYGDDHEKEGSDEDLTLIPTDKESDKSNDEVEEENEPWLREYRNWFRAAEHRLQNLQNKKRSLESELEKAKSVESTVQRANYITANMYLFTQGIRSATIQDWETGDAFELVLDSSFDSASQEADALFQQARKLKRGSQKIAELLEETSGALNTLSGILQDFSGVGVMKESMVRLLQTKLLQSSATTGFEAPSTQSTTASSRQQRGLVTDRSSPSLGSPSSNVRKILSPAGSIILIGRNRRGNEYISLSLAKGSDVWLHARGTPGAHVLIPQRRGSPPATPECLQLAANIAVFYSDARSERRADVTVASPKHILKPRNAPMGAVQLRQEDRVVVGFPADVPQELRLARDESGQSEEYRARDKNKNRKRTMAASAATSSSKRKRGKNG
jgi:hypothetical protein